MPTASSLSSTSIPGSKSPTMSGSSTTTGLSSVTESTGSRNQLPKMRDTNKLTSESSSLNFKQPVLHGHLMRSHTRKFCQNDEKYSITAFIDEELNESNREGGGDSGRGSLNSTDTCMSLNHSSSCLMKFHFRRYRW